MYPLFKRFHMVLIITVNVLVNQDIASFDIVTGQTAPCHKGCCSYCRTYAAWIGNDNIG